jgi:ribonuclease Z
VPENLLDPIEQIIDAWGRLDGSKVPANFVPVKPGDEYQIKPNLFTRVFPTKHSKGSVGYTVLEKRKKIKPEYAKLKSKQIVELKKQGVQIDNPIEIPIVTYLGDTQYVDFSKLDYITQSKILITECTFYEDEHKNRADVGKHMHVDELAKLLSDMNNEHIIVTHTTQRTALSEVRKMLKDSLPADKFKKITLFMDKRGRGRS